MGPHLRRRKHPRLNSQLYAELGVICSVTIGVRDQKDVFSNAPVAAAAVDVLRDHSSKTGVPIYGYCVMPDHVHLVLGPCTDCDIITFVGQFKNLAQRAAWRVGAKGRIWQTSFWDHFLRADEDIERVVDYVLYNPVRAGLVENRADYPFSGSLVFDV